jgi:hypothetical protein
MARGRITRVWNPNADVRMIERLLRAYQVSDWHGVAWAGQRILEMIRSPKHKRRHLAVLDSYLGRAA